MSQNIYEMLEKDRAVAMLKQAKAHMAIVIVAAVRDRRCTQAAAARLAKVSQPRMSDLMRGQLNRFSLDSMLTIAVRLGVPVATTFDGAQTLRIG